MKNFILLCCFFFLSGQAFAQIPGFQGKKCVIKYDMGLNHPTLVGRTGKLPMVNNNLSMDFVISRAWTVGFNYAFMAYKAPTRPNIFYSSYAVAVSNEKYPGLYMQHTVAFVAKKFFVRKGYLAPVGRYLLLGAYYQYATGQFTKAQTAYAGGDYVLTGFLHKKMVAHMGGVSLGLGRNFVVGRRMILDLGCTFSFSPFFIIDATAEYKYAYSEALLRNLFQLRLGIGGLAF